MTINLPLDVKVVFMHNYWTIQPLNDGSGDTLFNYSTPFITAFSETSYTFHALEQAQGGSTRTEPSTTTVSFLVLRDHGVYMYVVYIWKWSSAHALGGVSGVASFITTDEQLQ